MPKKISTTVRYFCALRFCVLAMAVLSSVQADIRNNGGRVSREPALSPSLCGNGRTDEDVCFLFQDLISAMSVSVCFC